MYTLFYILPIPLIYLAIHYQDPVQVKRYYETTYNMTFPNLYSPQVVVTTMWDNPWAISCIAGLFSACSILALVIVGCSYLSYQILKKTSTSLSITTKKHHINLLKSLSVLIFILGTDITVIIPLISCLLIFNSPRTGSWKHLIWLFNLFSKLSFSDYVNYLVMPLTSTTPLAIAGYFITYKPYRHYYKKKINRLVNFRNKATPQFSQVLHVLQ